jgi:hypothetical protein
MTQDLKQRVKSKDVWMRGLYMVLFAFIYGVTDFVLFATVIIQFLIRLLTGDINKQLQSFGYSLSQYIYQVILFLTFNTDDKPFPFDDWPSSPKSEEL